MRGNKLYDIEYLPSVVKTDIPDLPNKIKSMIKKAIEERLAIDPISYGKPLRHNLKGLRRLRVSNYRIVYYIENDAVIITAIKHRKDIYED